jgi:predicted DCC family thiol-disulfide oxidoreductase YuxK
VRFADAAERPDVLDAHGLSLDAVRLKLHAVDACGTVWRGAPALALAWAATAPYRWLGRLAARPPFSWAAAAGYHLAAHALYAWNRLCGRW